MQGIYLEELGLGFVTTCLEKYWEGIYFFLFFLAGVIWLLFQKKKERRNMAVYVIFLVLTIFNPVLVKYFFAPFNMDDVYYRFFWLLPVSILLGYFCTMIISCVKSWWKKVLLTVGCICLILAGGEPVKEVASVLQMPDNLYKVPDDVLEISEYIHHDSQEENPRVAAELELLMTLRQYDASLYLTLDRDLALCWQGAPNFQIWASTRKYQIEKAIMDVIYAGDISRPDEFNSAVEYTSTEYLVFSKNVDIQLFLQQNGFQFLAETDSYFLYSKRI
ncbi:MAG: hypothetical protein SO016_00675 [Lachnospiraceae bacterium]|nr:hypothetical protein [Lachnospiraceae bacterium]